MRDVVFALPGIALTIMCWGTYASLLHKGQHDLGSRLKPLICVGVAYFVIAIVVPVILLALQGALRSGWSSVGVNWSLAAGSAGALGALGIILALTAGGKPVYVMPLVFGCAPVVNTFISMYFADIPLRNIRPMFVVGLILVSVGAVTVLLFKPSPAKKPAASAVQEQREELAGEVGLSASGGETGKPATENAS